MLSQETHTRRSLSNFLLGQTNIYTRQLKGAHVINQLPLGAKTPPLKKPQVHIIRHIPGYIKLAIKLITIKSICSYNPLSLFYDISQQAILSKPSLHYS